MRALRPDARLEFPSVILYSRSSPGFAFASTQEEASAPEQKSNGRTDFPEGGRYPDAKGKYHTRLPQ
jgi:hypothetical protein